MEPLDLRSVNWLPGMLIRHQHLAAIDRHAELLSSWLLRHGSRYGVVSPPGGTQSPVELDVRIDRDELIVRLLRCTAITPGGGIVDVQPTSHMDARMIPEGRRPSDTIDPDRRIPVIVELMHRDAALLVGEPEEDGRIPWRLPRHRVHLDSEGVTDPSWALKIAELVLRGGRIEEAADYFPVTPWIQDIPALTVAFLRLFEKADRLRETLVQHLSKYPPHFASSRSEFPIQRAALSEVLVRLSRLDMVRPSVRALTAPDEAFAAFVAFLDGIRTQFESNYLLFDAVRVHYAELQPPRHPRAIDFPRELLAVRNWRFDPEGIGRHIERIDELFDHLLLAFDEPIREMMGPGSSAPAKAGGLVYKAKTYPEVDLALRFDREGEYLELLNLPAGTINQILIKFPTADLPSHTPFGARFAPDFRNIFDLKDGLVDLTAETGYAHVLLQVSRAVQRSVRVEFDPPEPFHLLQRTESDFRRTWKIGVI